MKLKDAEERRLQPRTGRELRYFSVGRGLPVLLVNGLGGPREVWRDLIAHFSDRYRFLFWEYHGLNRVGDDDGDPESAADGGGGVHAHASDAVAILDAENIPRASIIGWSMGVQVALELFQSAPSRVASLVLINGGARVAWASSARQTTRGKLMAQTLRVLRKSPRLVETALRGSLSAPEAFTWARRIGWVGDQVSAEAFAQIASGFLDLDVPSYLDTLERLAEYDGSDVLRHIDVPTLVIAGDRDPFTSRASMEQLASDVAGAEYLMLPGATHYVLLDQAERVNLRIEKFWNERGYRGQDRLSASPTPPAL